MTNSPAGYLVKLQSGLTGERGAAYDYVLAGNGVWVEAEGELMAARIQVADGQVRGLPELDQQVKLRHGMIPAYLFDLALNVMLAAPDRETYAGIIWTDRYQLYVPEQVRKSSTVTYRAADNTVLELHSHGLLNAFFSEQDDSDEQGLKIYGVLGQLHRQPRLMLRAGLYGYFGPVEFNQIFSGACHVEEQAYSIENIEMEEWLGDGVHYSDSAQ